MTNTPEPGARTPLCWCDQPMTQLGAGAYPYDCPAKDTYPDDMVWTSHEHGHSGWTHDHGSWVDTHHVADS